METFNAIVKHVNVYIACPLEECPEEVIVEMLRRRHIKVYYQQERERELKRESWWWWCSPTAVLALASSRGLDDYNRCLVMKIK